MMEALEGERIDEGLNGDPLSLLKERKATGYLMISGIDESADAALISIDGDVIGAEFLSDEGQWLGKDALDRIRHLKNTWVDLFSWDRKSLERVMAATPKAKISMTKEDVRSVIEERRSKRLEALRNSKAASEKGRGLTGLFAKVSEQVKDLEPDTRSAPQHATPHGQPPTAASQDVPPAGDGLPVEVAELHAIQMERTGASGHDGTLSLEIEAVRELHEATRAVEEALAPITALDAPRRPSLLSRPAGAKAQKGAEVSAAEPAVEGADEPHRSFEEAISDGIDELKRLSNELDQLLDK